VTAPGGSVGTAYISLFAKTDQLAPSIDRELRKAADDADDFLDDAGTRWGDTISESTSKEIRGHGRDFASSIEHALTGQVVSLGGVKYRTDRRGFLHDLDTGEFAGRVVGDVVDAFQKASREGGVFSKVGEGISDAIGAGFNVSGKSPLIALLIPAFGAIALVIAAAVQAVNALIAVLVEVPGLLLAIGIQAGILVLAFKGVGTAIQGAFAAKNATELYEAIKGLTPAAQDFVRSLLPLRDLFNQIQDIAQQNFFLGLSNVLSRIAATLGPIFTGGNFAALARALGDLFNQIGSVFASPAFADLVSDVIPATLRWLSQFGPGFTNFLMALIKMADAALPGLERLGMIVGNAFGTFTDWLNQQIQNGNLTDWLSDMGDTLDHVSELFFNAARFVASFLDALNKSGGNDTIDQLGEFFNQLAVFFQSEAGQAAMDGFIHLVEALTFAFSGLVFGMLGVLIAFEAVLEFLGFLGAKFQEFLGWLAGPAADVIGEFFTETFPGWVSGLAQDVSDFFGKIVFYIESGIGAAIDWVHKKWDEFLAWWSGVVNGFVDFFAGIPDRLADIGRSIMQGLRDGLQWGWDHTVGPILKWITSQIPSWKGPLERDKKLLEPAGKAAMEGFGRGLKQGAGAVKDMLGEFTNAIRFGGLSSNNTFNSNLNFFGQPPTTTQARSAGRAVSEELNSQVAARDVSLAVRMI
jgi:hypothetical protein